MAAISRWAGPSWDASPILRWMRPSWDERHLKTGQVILGCISHPEMDQPILRWPPSQDGPDHPGMAAISGWAGPSQDEPSQDAPWPSQDEFHLRIETAISGWAWGVQFRDEHQHVPMSA